MRRKSRDVLRRETVDSANSLRRGDGLSPFLLHEVMHRIKTVQPQYKEPRFNESSMKEIESHRQHTNEKKRRNKISI